MMKRTRALATAAVGAVALSTAAAVAPTATAASPSPNSYAYAAARWLEDQLVDDLAVYSYEYEGATYETTDYGLTIDVLLALNDLGVRTATQSRILSALETHADDYVAGWGVAPAAAGKLAVAARAAGEDPTAFGGRNLIADVADNTDDTTGETSDTYGGVGQAWATWGLAAGNSSELTKSVEFLLSQQCPDGGFKQVYKTSGGATVPCPAELAVDSTAFAIQALTAAKTAGATGVDDDIADAVAALVKAQAADGSIGNANSTGLAAKVLDRAGEKGAAGSAAAWLVKHQVTDAVADGTKLATDAGAVALDDDALAAGKADGIEVLTLGQWIRATAQASSGVQALLPAATVTVAQPAAFVAAGASVAVTASGLTPGERYTAAISGGETKTGIVPATGPVLVTVQAPAGSSVRSISVTGSRSSRAGTTTTPVLAAKKLTPTLARTKVKRGKTQRVTVRGFAAGEPVKVYYRGKVVRTGVATTSGTFTRAVKVGRKTGKVKVTVRGAFSNRSGVKTFRVVK